MIVTAEAVEDLAIRYIHFSFSVLWWGIMFFMFIIIFPANKDGHYSPLFPRVQKFMKFTATIAMASGISLLFINTRVTTERLLGSSWGFTILAGAILSSVVYLYIMLPKNNKISLPSTSVLVRPTSPGPFKKPTLPIVGTGQRRSISKRTRPRLLFIFLTITIGLMVYASHGFL
ncbi:hypothetical protein [Nitrososphaera sp. AFS]|uniref:hypothetical protein n=1 Tax=Nitrososphaera sp. AFS TaxID=2301191 RepID=UPI0013923BD4|nr:hypothetical protein [Nitrososphaera sp. AFS]NAL77587.1 hypothetical protein [Nitrososphaera sp. AFS]